MMYFQIDFLRRALHAIQVVVENMDDGPIRPHLYGVHLRQTKDEWSVVATNGHWLAAITRPVVEGHIPESIRGGEGEYLFPAQYIKRFLRDLRAAMEIRENGQHSKRTKKWLTSEWVRFDFEEMEATHFAGKFCLPEVGDGNRGVPWRKIVPSYTDETPKCTIALNLVYLSLVNEVSARFAGRSPKSLRAEMRTVHVLSGAGPLDPILFVPRVNDMDAATCDSKLQIVVMPVRD